MTGLGAHAEAVAAFPRGVDEVARIIQGVLLHRHWEGAYQVRLTPERADQQHLRPAAATLDAALVACDRPLTEPRPAADRAVGICRHFTTVAVAILRAQGIPARARVGFGAYFNRGTFEDHWVVEYWNEGQARWVLADAQLDELQRSVLKPDFDVLDVPRDRFIIAGDAWKQCREGGIDPLRFGIFDMRGRWFIAGNLLRDVAALNNMEMLPWDSWGAMNGPDEPFTEERPALLDHLAALTLDADSWFAELRALYESDASLRVPAEVRNALTDRMDAVAA